MAKKERRPGDPYDVGYGKPPKRTRFKKGRSGNPNGRPRKKPDLYVELTKVLGENVTVTVDGQPEQVTVQQALLLRLRDRALRGAVWAEKLLQRVIAAIPEGASIYDQVDREMLLFRPKALLGLLHEESQREKAEQNPKLTEAGNGE
jgi:hypothetical protein